MTGSARQDDQARIAQVETTVDEALTRTGRDGHALAVLLVAVHDAARLDRTCGHAAGSAALAQLAARVRAVGPPEAVVLPLSRDRLAVVLEHVAGPAHAAELASALAAAARAPVDIAERTTHLDATVGAALARGELDAGGALLRDAEGAAHRARVACTPWALAEPGAPERELRRLQVEDELTGALARDELALYLQPIVSLRRGTLLGLEALVRWQHPTRGLIGPAQFIPVAEESGQIVEIGAWMLSAVCAELERWGTPDGRPAPPVALNVSPRELCEAGFGERIEAALAASGLPGERLVLEVAAAPSPAGEAAEALASLRARGVRIVLDRFGGEGAGLADLPRLPLDGLKVDRSLLPPAPGPASPIVTAVVELAHAMGLTITIPGVETEQQLALVRSLQVDATQGHLIARPRPARAIASPHELARDVTGSARAGAGGSGERGDELLSLSTVAGALGVSPSTVRRLADQGVLPGTRTEGGHRRFRRADVQRIARERGRAPGLRPWELPGVALPASAALLEHDGGTLVERTVRGLYAPGHPGWLATPQGLARGREWLEQLVVAAASGTPGDAVAATADYAAAAALGGASAAEVVRFLAQFSVVTTHELLRTGGSGEEARVVQRVMSAATEAFLEHAVP